MIGAPVSNSRIEIYLEGRRKRRGRPPKEERDA